MQDKNNELVYELIWRTLVAVAAEVAAVFMGFQTSGDAISERRSHSILPGVIIALAGLLLAIATTAKMFKLHRYGLAVCACGVTLVCLAIGLYAWLAASLQFWF